MKDEAIFFFFVCLLGLIVCDIEMQETGMVLCKHEPSPRTDLLSGTIRLIFRTKVQRLDFQGLFQLLAGGGVGIENAVADLSGLWEQAAVKEGFEQFIVWISKVGVTPLHLGFGVPIKLGNQGQAVPYGEEIGQHGEFCWVRRGDVSPVLQLDWFVVKSTVGAGIVGLLKVWIVVDVADVLAHASSVGLGVVALSRAAHNDHVPGIVFRFGIGWLRIFQVVLWIIWITLPCDVVDVALVDYEVFVLRVNAELAQRCKESSLVVVAVGQTHHVTGCDCCGIDSVVSVGNAGRAGRQGTCVRLLQNFPTSILTPLEKVNTERVIRTLWNERINQCITVTVCSLNPLPK